MNKTLLLAACLALFIQMKAEALVKNATTEFSRFSEMVVAPIAADDSYTIDEDTDLTDDVSENDTNAPTDVYIVITDVSNGTLSLNSDGTFTYMPNQDFFGTDVFVYEVCNNLNECSEATVTIEVSPINDAPVTETIVYEADFNGVLNASVTNAITDVDDTVLIYTLDETTLNGTLVFNEDGSFTYTPFTNYSGTDSFTYTVCDPHSACVEAIAQLLIIDPDEMPTVVDDQYTLDEGTVFSGNVGDNDSDPDGDELTFSVEVGPLHGVFVLQQDGSFTYEPNQYYYGQDTVIYRACDPTPFCAFGMVVFTVLPLNSAPVAVDDYVVGEQNDVLVYNVSNNDFDPEGDLLVYSLVSGVTQGTLDFNANGSFTYTPNQDYYGQDSFQYEVCDNEYCDSAFVFITIDQINFTPIAVDDLYSTTQGSPLSADVSTNDNMNNGGEGTYSVVTDVTNGVLLLNADGTFAYTPAPGFFGTDVFTYSVCNPNNLCDEATATIVVDELNTIPVAQDDFFTIPEDGFLFASVATNDSDADGDVLTYTVEIGVNHGTLVFNDDGSFTYTPNLNFFGTDNFTYTACDLDGNCDVATVTIVVTSVNDAPVANDDFYTTEQNTEVSGFVGNNDTDVDDNQLVYTIDNLPTNGAIIFNSDGTFIYTPNAGFIGTDTFTYTACDDEGLCDTATVTITVVEAQQPIPQVVIDQYTTNEDEVLYGDVSINDINTGGFIYTVVQQPSNGTVDMGASGSFVYTPNPDYNGFDEFVYQACDLIGNCYQATVNIIIVPMPDDDLRIPLGFSPNNDGTNDKFIIENIDSYPNNKLSIFNRWGNVVYEKAPYTEATSWDGTSDVGAVSFGSMVPEGTYFYVLDTGPSTLNEGKSEKKSGYIVVKYESK